MADEIEVILHLLQKYHFTNAEAAFKAELLAREREGSPLSSSGCALDWGMELRLDALQAADHVVLSDHIPPYTSKRELHGNGSDHSDKAEGTSLSRSPPEKHLFLEFESGKFQEPGSEIIPAQEFAFNNIRALPEPDAAPSPPSAISNSIISIFQFESAPSQPSQEGFGHHPASIQNSNWVDQGEGGVNKGLPKHLPWESKVRQLGEDKQVAPLFNKGNSSRDLITGHILDRCLAGFENELVQHVNGGILGEDDSYRTDLSKIKNKGYLEGCTPEDDSMSRDNGSSTRPDASGDNTTKVERGGQRQQALRGIDSALEGLRKDCSKISSRYEKGVSQSPALKTSLPLGLSDYYTPNDNAQGSVRVNQETFIDVAARALERVNGDVKFQEAEVPSSERERTGVATVEGAEESRLLKCHDKHEGLTRLSPRPEEFPKLPHVRLRSIDRNIDQGDSAEVSFQATESAAVKSMASSQERSFSWDAFSGGPLNEDLPSAGLKWLVSRPSVSQGIVEDMPDMLSGFGIAGDGQSERGFPDDYCNSDTYEDDDDPGYHRQPIEDEEWFYAHETDYPSDDERAGQHIDKSNQAAYKQSEKVDEDDQLFVEEEVYFSGEEYYKSQVASQGSKEEATKLELRTQGGKAQPNCTDLDSTGNDSGILSQSREGGNGYVGKLFDAQEISKIRSEPVWQGFMSRSDELRHVGPVATGDFLGNVAIDDEHHGSVRSGGIALSSDAADVGSELRDSLVGGSSEGDIEGFRDQEFAAYRPGHGNFHLDEIFDEKIGRHLDVKRAPVRHTQDEDEEDQGDMILHFYNEAWGHTKRVEDRCAAGIVNKREISKPDLANTEHLKNCASKENGVLLFEGFSFPSPASTGDIPVSRAGSGKSLWSNRESGGQDEETDGCGSGIVGPDDTLAAWKRKSNGSSPIVCPSEANLPDLGVSNRSTLSINSSEEFVSLEARDNLDFGCLPESCQPLDQDEGAVQEEISRLSAEEDQYEIFNLRIIHRKNRTGFEEEKDLSVVLNSVIAGRYHVTEYLGSAAFSKAIQAHDLHTGMDVCMKIIKNNKDFFDQSLDEIKLLKYVNRHDPADRYHILRLYDYFYHREHLFIVCELLRANLYEFHKFNRESGGEIYFTMSRLQSITRQCLEALEFLHKLGIIHCDLKPENILVKSYSRCEIKIIDLGSSCFQTDHLCSYVQSRSYRAPEVILGLPYDQKIDIWSLGCILAELCSGNVLFQNDSLATLLARVVGILGPIDPDVLAKGKDTHKYFTKNHTLYEKNQETDQLEYLLPKKTSLRHRLPMGDPGFVEFVGYLLQNNPAKRPTASEALKHPWLSYPYEPISS